MKMTILMVNGNREAIEVDTSSDKGATDDDMLALMVAKWIHALTCETGHHFMQFRCYPSGESMVVIASMIGGFSLKVQVLQ